MNLQHQRIQHACVTLKLDTLASEWAAIADHSASNDSTLADFLEQLLHLELQARQQRTRDTLLKFAGFPGRKEYEDYDFKFASGAPRPVALAKATWPSAWATKPSPTASRRASSQQPT